MTLCRSVLSVLVSGALLLAATASFPAVSGHTAGGVPSDYAAEAFSDPWDYSNVEDQIIADDGPMRSATNATISGGQLHFDMARPGYFHPLWGGYPGAIPHGREGLAHPIDASRYNRISFRMNATAEVPAGIRWYTCQEISDACQGGFNFFTKPGWNTYDFALAPINEANLTTPWMGKIVSLRVALSPSSSAHFDVDWLQVSPSGSPVGEGLAPVPQIDEPSITGGADYATISRNGDAWDFNEASDVHRLDNATGAASGGVFSGTNAGPAMNDPAIGMRLNQAFKGSDFHRVTVDYTYDGPFNLEDRASGGTTARIIWRIAGTPLTKNGADLQNSDDIVTYPNEKSFTVDLAAANPVDITDPAQNGPRIGWAGQMIEMFRFDPNEDRGRRSFRIDRIKVADVAAGEKSFDIAWKDNSFAAGTTADLYVDTDDHGFDGTQIAAARPVQSGRNVFTWTPPSGTTGTWYVYVVHTRNGQVGRAYSGGPLRIGGITSAAAYQFGGAVDGPSSQVGVTATGSGPKSLALRVAPPRSVKGAKSAGGATLKLAGRRATLNV